MCPWGIRQAINWATGEYGAPDIYITENGFRSWAEIACPFLKTVVVYRQGRAALNCFKVVDCLPSLLLQWSLGEHWRSAEDLLLQALPQPGKFSPLFIHIFEYFKSRCWRQSSWMGSQWRATMPGASLTTLSEWKEKGKSGETIMSIFNQVGDGLHWEVWSPQREYERSREDKDPERVVAIPLSTCCRKWILRIRWTLLKACCSTYPLDSSFAKYTSVSDSFSFWVNLES